MAKTPDCFGKGSGCQYLVGGFGKGPRTESFGKCFLARLFVSPCNVQIWQSFGKGFVFVSLLFHFQKCQTFGKGFDSGALYSFVKPLEKGLTWVPCTVFFCRVEGWRKLMIVVSNTVLSRFISTCFVLQPSKKEELKKYK